MNEKAKYHIVQAIAYIAGAICIIVFLIDLAQ